MIMEWTITHNTESVPKLLIHTHQEMVTVELVVNNHAQKTLSPLVEHQLFLNPSVVLKMLLTQLQYQFALMLQTGPVIVVVFSTIVELQLITAYNLLDIVVTLIG